MRAPCVSWRGETWTPLSVRIAEISTYRPRVLNYVAKLAEDMTTTIGEWVPVVMPHPDDGWIDAVVPIDGELRFYYRHGGATGDFRYLTAQG